MNLFKEIKITQSNVSTLSLKCLNADYPGLPDTWKCNVHADSEAVIAVELFPFSLAHASMVFVFPCYLGLVITFMMPTSVGIVVIVRSLVTLYTVLYYCSMRVGVVGLNRINSAVL